MQLHRASECVASGDCVEVKNPTKHSPVTRISGGCHRRKALPSHCIGTEEPPSHHHSSLSWLKERTTQRKRTLLVTLHYPCVSFSKFSFLEITPCTLLCSNALKKVTRPAVNLWCLAHTFSLLQPYRSHHHSLAPNLPYSHRRRPIVKRAVISDIIQSIIQEDFYHLVSCSISSGHSLVAYWSVYATQFRRRVASRELIGAFGWSAETATANVAIQLRKIYFVSIYRFSCKKK